MSFEAEQALRPELDRGERLLWGGRPRQGLLLRPADALIIPFSLLWGGFALFWEYSVLNTSAPFFFRLWGIPFVLVGLYMIVGRFFADSRLRARTWYGITDRRVIIVAGLFSHEVKSLSLGSLGEVSLNERGDRSGSITFGPTSPMYSRWSGTPWPGMGNKLPPTFEPVEEVRRVYDVLREAQRQAGRQSP